MSYLNDNKSILDMLSGKNKTFIHLHSSKTHYTNELSDLHNISRDVITKHSFGGICFDIEPIKEYYTKTEIGNDCYIPVIKCGLGEDLASTYCSALKGFSAPSRLGALICTIDRPFLAYKSLFLFPHEMCRFDYMIIYHGWGSFKSTRYPFESIFDKYRYSIEHKDDSIYVVRKI